MAPATPTKEAAAKSAGSDKEIEFIFAVIQCFEAEPKVDLDKLQKITGMPSKAAANAKWWRIKQKYMYKATAPQKRKSDGDGDDENDSVAKPKPVKTPRKTKATKNNAKLKDEDDELDAKVDKKTEATAAPEALDNSRV